MDELQVGGGGDVDVAPLLGEEVAAQGLHTLVEQHAQLWHLCTHLYQDDMSLLPAVRAAFE